MSNATTRGKKFSVGFTWSMSLLTVSNIATLSRNVPVTIGAMRGGCCLTSVWRLPGPSRSRHIGDVAEKRLGTVKRAKKRSTCFAALLQNECVSHQPLSNLSGSKSGCCTLRKFVIKVESEKIFALKTNLFCRK